MNPESALGQARAAKLYPAVILHGGTEPERRGLAVQLGRTLLCSEESGRPCGRCRNCRRIAWPEGRRDQPFHPDFRVLERDLKTSTSVAATREMLSLAQLSPFEARGQVFVIAAADSLSLEAANSLLKALEEPPETAPRHFLLLAPSRLDLLPTLRSRSLAIYLGPGEELDPESVAGVAEEVRDLVGRFRDRPSALYLLAIAAVLKGAGDWTDPRSGRPWALAAAAVSRAAYLEEVGGELRRALLGLAQSLLEAPSWRLRGITPERILEGLIFRSLSRFSSFGN